MKSTIFKELLHSLLTPQRIQFSHSNILSCCVKKRSLFTVRRGSDFPNFAFISAGLACTKTRNAGMPERRNAGTPERLNAGILKPGTQNY